VQTINQGEETMKKLLLVFIAFAVLFMGCVTNPYTTEDAKKPRKLVDKRATWWTSFVPGLTQIINGEYVKGAILMAGTLGLSTTALLSQLEIIPNPSVGLDKKDSDDNVIGQYHMAESLGIAALSAWAGSYIDGTVSTYKLHEQRWKVENPGYENPDKKNTVDTNIRIADFKGTGPWEIRYYADEFGDFTGEAYITTKGMIEGTFSNSATNNSKLNVKLIIDKNKFGFDLFEYGYSQVKNVLSDAGEYNVLFQDGQGNRYNTTATLSTTRFYFKNRHRQKISEVISRGGTIKFSIKDGDSLDSYRFDIEETEGFSEAYYALFGKYP
jgi:hypothetical protein